MHLPSELFSRSGKLLVVVVVVGCEQGGVAATVAIAMAYVRWLRSSDCTDCVNHHKAAFLKVE